MSWKEFRTSAPAKWVLSGEHAVLRGGEAIALPHPQFSLALHYVPGSEPLRVIPEIASLPIQDLIRNAIEALEKSHRGLEIPWPNGILNLESTIPLGAGLGSSAALCVAMTRWILGAFAPDSVNDRAVIDFARTLEDRFHGRSSGMDVTVITLGKPILFSMSRGARILEFNKLPKFEFHDTGMRSATRECIARVEAIAPQDPARATRLDETMRRASALALDGLETFQTDESTGLNRICESMQISKRVFEEWGLIPKEIRPRLDQVESEARAARLTGAGGGGFIVSLRRQ